MAVLGYLPKVKRGLELPFGAHFCMIFPQKGSSFSTLSMDKVSMSYLFSLTADIKQNVLLTSYLDS